MGSQHIIRQTDGGGEITRLKTTYTDRDLFPNTCEIFPIIITRRYGLLRGPTSSSCGGLWPSAEAFFALWAKKELIMLIWPIFGIFGVQ